MLNYCIMRLYLLRVKLRLQLKKDYLKSYTKLIVKQIAFSHLLKHFYPSGKIRWMVATVEVKKILEHSITAWSIFKNYLNLNSQLRNLKLNKHLMTMKSISRRKLEIFKINFIKQKGICLFSMTKWKRLTSIINQKLQWPKALTRDCKILKISASLILIHLHRKWLSSVKKHFMSLIKQIVSFSIFYFIYR